MGLSICLPTTKRSRGNPVINNGIRLYRGLHIRNNRIRCYVQLYEFRGKRYYKVPCCLAGHMAILPRQRVTPRNYLGVHLTYEISVLEYVKCNLSMAE